VKTIKRLAAALFVAVMILSFASCKETSYAATYAGEEISSGIYSCFVLDAYSDAQSNGYIKGGESLKDMTIDALDGMKVTEYIENLAKENTQRYIAVLAKFNDVGFKLEGEEYQQNVELAKQNYAAKKDVFSANGIGEDSFVKVLADHSTRVSMLFNAKYGEEGTDPVSDEELITYLEENFAKVNFIYFIAVDPDSQEGADLPSDHKDIKNIEIEFKDIKSRVDKKKLDFAKFCETYGEQDPTYRTGGQIGQIIQKSETDEISKAIFSTKVGKTNYFSDGNQYMLIQRIAIDDKEHSFMKSQRAGLVSLLNRDDFLNELLEYGKSLDIVMNEDAFSQFSIENAKLEGYTSLITVEQSASASE
jgi:hypothetical protein